MRRKGYTSLDEPRGLLAVPEASDQNAFERAGYVRALHAANAGHGPWE
jgi:dihydroorotate dehydrogenase (fumarate)